jgi:Class III cytochrome C family
MKKILPILIAAICFSLGLFAVNSTGSENDNITEIMVLKTVNAKKPARFPHKQHQETFACKECHHGKTESGSMSPYVEGMEVMKCAACHNNIDMTNPKLNSFKLAAHGLCKGCHKQNRPDAPTKCSGCHIK